VEARNATSGQDDSAAMDCRHQGAVLRHRQSTAVMGMGGVGLHQPSRLLPWQASEPQISRHREMQGIQRA